MLALSVKFRNKRIAPLFSVNTSLNFILKDLTKLPPVIYTTLKCTTIFKDTAGALLTPILVKVRMFNIRGKLTFFTIYLITFLIGNGHYVCATRGQSF